MNSPYRLLEALQLMAKSQDVVRDTHGNVSCLAPGGVISIKPSGMAYDQITREDICEAAIIDGHPLGYCRRKPSVDLPHHLSIYQRHPWIGAICHTHSPYATAFALAEEDIECLSTEQADYFGGAVYCELYRDLDSWGSKVCLSKGQRAVLLGSHGCLTFADDPVEAVRLAVALENVAQKTYLARQLMGSHEYEDRLTENEIEKWHRRYRESYGQR